VIGVVLNQFNTKDAQRYQGDYGYYQAYGADYAIKQPAGNNKGNSKENSKENTKA
jgi:succinoglycan biosynthesis transport protein ExoP